MSVPQDNAVLTHENAPISGPHMTVSAKLVLSSTRQLTVLALAAQVNENFMQKKVLRLTFFEKYAAPLGIEMLLIPKIADK